MNKYGDAVAASIVGMNDEINMILGSPVRIDSDSGLPVAQGAMAKVTGRIGLLPLKEQNDLYEQLINEYNAFIDAKESLGENELEAKVKPLDARVLETFEISPADDQEANPFTSAVIAQRMDIKRLSKPLTLQAVQEAINKARNGKDPTELRKEQVESFNKGVMVLRNETGKELEIGRAHV